MNKQSCGHYKFLFYKFFYLNLKTKSCKIKTYGDHRIACSFMILALLNKNIKIDNEKCVSISYPKFKRDLKSLIK